MNEERNELCPDALRATAVSNLRSCDRDALEGIVGCVQGLDLFRHDIEARDHANPPDRRRTILSSLSAAVEDIHHAGAFLDRVVERALSRGASETAAGREISRLEVLQVAREVGPATQALAAKLKDAVAAETARLAEEAAGRAARAREEMEA